MKKRILIAMHEYSGFYKNMEWDLNENNYKTSFLLYKDNPTKKKNRFFDILRYKYEKLITKKALSKNKKFLEYDLLSQLKKYPKNHFHYSLTIRADFYSDSILKEINRVCITCISYHWDGLDRFPEIKNKIKYFEDFYVFEIKDFVKYKPHYENLKLTTNFYFEHNKPKETYDKTDVFYIGEFLESRKDDIINIYTELKKLNLNIKIKFWSTNKETIQKLQSNDIQFFQQTLDYSDVLELSKSSKIVIDILVKGENRHSGLSLRFFEALHHKNKIITDNIEVLKYDFYSSKNIFIIGHDPIESLPLFIETEIQQINSNITKKYSFTSWVEQKMKNKK